jgi:hypothetical protein
MKGSQTMDWSVLGRRCLPILAAAATAVLAAGLVPATASGAAPVAPGAPLPAAAAADVVRAIVGLDVEFEPSRLRGIAERQAMSARIATAGAEVEADLRGQPVTIHRRYGTLPYLALSAPAAALDALHKSGRVTSVQRDELATVSLADSTRIVGSAEATRHGFDGTNQVIAVLDTGVDSAHPFLAGRVVEEACFSGNSNCPNGSTTQTGAGAGVPCTFAAGDCQHGTHVAGIAAGRRSGAIGFDGVAPDADVMSVQVFSRFTTGCRPGVMVCAKSFTSDQLAALQRVLDRVEDGVQVAAVNMSLGGNPQSTACDTDPLKPAIDSLRAVGVPTVIASGNDGNNTGVSVPGCISTAITVGNTTKADAVNANSNSSTQVELLAPGTDIVSSVPGGGTAAFTGTSMATPHVAGAWAVYRERFPGASVATVLAALRNTGTRVTDPDNNVTVPRINLSAAMAGWAFVWADQPVASSYTPNTQFQANSTGAINQITRSGVGNYVVRMPGLGGRDQAIGVATSGNVQVNAQGTPSHRCKVVGSSLTGVELSVSVRCHTTAGAAVDTRFMLLYQANETVRPADYGYAQVEANNSAPLLRQANSSAATAVNTVSHAAGSGIYTVLFPGLTDGGGNAQVTALGTDTSYCKIRSTTVSGSGTTVVVGCHTASGTLTDARFYVAYTAGVVPSGRAGAYGLANQPTSTSFVDLASRFNTSGGVVQARRAPDPATPGAFLTGVYEVRLGNQAAANDTTALATAVGTDNTSCNVETWVASGANTIVTVRCRTAAGTLVNSQFSVLYTTNL